jgi:hypothetical protein
LHARYIEPVRAFRLSNEFISASAMSWIEKQLRTTRRRRCHIALRTCNNQAQHIHWPFGYCATALSICCDRDQSL